MMNRMIVANLVHRPFRTIISVVAVAVEVTLILLIVGIMLGMLNDARSGRQGIGADIMVQPPGSSLLMGVSGAPVSVKVADKLRQASPTSSPWRRSSPSSPPPAPCEVLDGIDMQSFDAVSGRFHYLSGGPFQGANDMIVDDLEAGSKHLKVGDTLEALNHEFRISGIVEHGKGAREFVPTGHAARPDRRHRQGFDLLREARRSQHGRRSGARHQEHPRHAAVRRALLKEYLSLMTSASIPGLTTFINVVIGIAVIIGFIVIFQAMYAAVMERTREIGILKSLGAGKLYIVNAILRETILIGIGGIILGIGISYCARDRSEGEVPDLAGADHARAGC